METEYMMNQTNEEQAQHNEEKIEKQKRESQKYFAVIISQVDSGFDCILEAENKKNLQEQLDKLSLTYAASSHEYSIAGIFKGYSLNFRETKQITFD